VQLDIPADERGVARRIRSVTLEASGPPDAGIQSARFAENVEFSERRAASTTDAAIERSARSKTLNTVVGAGFSAIDAAEFGGGVSFHDGALDATAPSASYAVGKGTLKLVAGPPGTPGARVSDERATIDARTIDLTLEGRGMVADGDVRSLMKPTPRGAAPEGGRAVKRPGLLRDDQVANVIGKHLAYDSASGKAVYTGDARLWQGETAVQGNTLTIDDAQGNLQAAGNVKSTLRLEQTDQKTGKKEPRTTVVTSGELLYEDAVRRATYTTAARLVGPEGDLRADKIEMYLLEGGGELERLEAYGKVSLRSQNRASTGARLTYFAADGRYVMGGAPVRVLEQLPTECRETIGKTLTFFRSTDTISVDGNEEGRTQTTSGGKCQEPRTS
jgi:lipopolysaccharide export system protein LptA